MLTRSYPVLTPSKLTYIIANRLKWFALLRIQLTFLPVDYYQTVWLVPFSTNHCLWYNVFLNHATTFVCLRFYLFPKRLSHSVNNFYFNNQNHTEAKKMFVVYMKINNEPPCPCPTLILNVSASVKQSEKCKAPTYLLCSSSKPRAMKVPSQRNCRSVLWRSALPAFSFPRFLSF